MIAGARDGDFVDHINGDRLDNRRANLRLCSQSQNLMNRAAKSGFKGVYRRRDCDRWAAEIKVDRRKTYLGLFLTAEEAARAYDVAACRLHGDFARLNFPKAA